jgi:hypothetical protein
MVINMEVVRFEVTANVVPRSLIVSILMMEAVLSSETLVLRRATRHHISENGILRSHRRENLTSYQLRDIKDI